MIRTNAFRITPHQPERFFQPVNNALMSYRQGMDRKTVRDDQQEAESYRRHQGELARTDARNALMYSRKREQEKFDYRKQQDALANARSNRKLAMQAREHQAKMRPQQAAADPLAGYGLDENGNLVPPPVTENRVLADGDTLSTTTTYGTPRMDFGQRGLAPEDVPGVVVNPKGRGSDKFATERNDGQSSMSRATPEQQARYKRFQDTQRRWQLATGQKAPSGHIYAEDGSLIDLRKKGATSQQRQMVPMAQAALKRLKRAANTLTKDTLGNNVLTRTAAQMADYGETGNAVAEFQQSALQIVYALSGKQTAVKEMELFLNAYAPKPFDSAWRITKKAGNLEEMLNGLIAGVQSGKSYEDAFAAAASGAASKGGKPQEPTPEQMSDDDLLKALQQ